jgi:flagellin
MRINNIGISNQNNLSNINRQLTNQLKKLVSFKNINQAADDAAGLAVANRFMSQLSGNRQATYNIQDGISLLQTADGGFETVSDIQHRLRDLSVQAASDTLTDSDRELINIEARQLVSELDRMTESVQFNQHELFSGDFSEDSGSLVIQAGGNEDETIKVNIEEVSSTALGLESIDLSTAEGARAAIGKIDSSISLVSQQRANIGAMTNRFESSYNFSDIQYENQLSSYSQIMDTDVATSLVAFTTQQLLQDVSLSMIAQSNFQRSSVLDLF